MFVNWHTIRKNTITPILSMMNVVGSILALLIFSLLELRRINSPDIRIMYEETVMQVYEAGVKVFPLIAIISLSIGIVVSMLASSLLSVLPVNIIAGTMLSLIVRELGPLLTSIIIVARSGTVISTELSAMVLNHELEAIEAIGVDPLRIIVLPRILALMLSMLILNMSFSIISIFAGLFISTFIGADIIFSDFILVVLRYASVNDLIITLTKSLVLGGILSVTSLYYGFKVTDKRMSVSDAAKKGVINGFLWTFIFNGIITVLSFIANM